MKTDRELLSLEEIRARLAEPEDEPVRLSDEEIREIMLAHGFVIKDGHSDLKPYVFQAIRAVEQAVLEKNQ